MNDATDSFSVAISIGDRVHHLTLRRGRAGDLFVLYEILAGGTYRIAPALIAPETVETIIDCGANIGLTSLYFSSVYPAARIYSVEADPENFTLLKANTRNEPRIVPIHACVVGSPQASVSFNAGGPGWGRKRGVSGDACGEIMVPAITLDSLLAKYGIGRVDLLKLDIEGAECEVLATGDYLAVVQHVIAELHDDYAFEDFTAAVGKYEMTALRAGQHCKMITAHRQPS